MNEYVWARDPTEGYVLGRIAELTEEGAEVVPLNNKYPKRILPFSEIYRAQDDEKKDYDDNCKCFIS